MEGVIRWQRSFWAVLASRRLAVILIAALASALILISLFPQMPVAPTSQETWLQAVKLRYGPATATLEKLGVFEAYHSPWFLALLSALLLNTVACTVQRTLRLWRSLRESPVIKRPEAFYQGFAHRIEWTLGSREQGLGAVRDALVRRRFHPHIEGDEITERVYIYAERGRWSQAATIISHLAVVLFFVAVAVRPALGWQENTQHLLPGQVYRVGHGYDLDVRPGQLNARQPPSVPLTVLKDTGAITGTVRVNQPLTFRGVSFHLLGYGPAVRITAPEGTSGATFSGSQAQQIALPEAGFTLRVALRPHESTLFVEALAADGVRLGSGSVSNGQEIEIGGTRITFDLTNYTVWQVSRDPTFGIAVISAVLLLAAVVTSLWVPYRRLWLRVDDERKAQMVGAGDWAGVFDTFATQIAGTCPPQGERDG